MKEFRPAKKQVEVSVGESVRVVRELQELSQSQLAELTGIVQATLSAIENGRVNLGVERAKVLARALKAARESPGSITPRPGWSHSIRINDRWRVCFVWTKAGPENVEIADYH